MGRYHAMLAPPRPDRPFRRVSVSAKTIEEARQIFIARHGVKNVLQVWTEEAEGRDGQE